MSRTLESTSEAGEMPGVFRISFTWLLLLAYLVGSCFLPAEIISASMLLVIVFFLADPYAGQSRLLFPGALFFIIILLSGTRGMAGKAPYDVAKDLWYLGNPALTLLFGYLLTKRMDGLLSVMRAFVVAAIIVAVVHIFKFILNPSYLDESLIDIRAQVSSGYLITALGIGIIVGNLRFGLDLLQTRLASWLGIILCLLSITLSFSRTLWLCLMTLVLVSLIMNFPRAALRIVIAATVFIIVGLAATGGYRMATETGPDLTFVDKIMYSMRELQVSDYEDRTDINRNWRGYESYRALQTYASGSSADYLFGKGLGTSIDLGITMTLADEVFDRIPILHNGYLYLLVKTGAIGLISYLLYLLVTFIIGMQLFRLPEAEARFCGFLLVVLTIIMLETTLVIAGMFNKSWVYTATLLIGVLLGYSESKLLKDPQKLHLFRCYAKAVDVERKRANSET